MKEAYTQFARLAHNPRDEKSHHPEVDVVVAHIPFLQQLGSIGVDLFGIPPAAKDISQINFSYSFISCLGRGNPSN